MPHARTLTPPSPWPAAHPHHRRPGLPTVAAGRPSRRRRVRNPRPGVQPRARRRLRPGTASVFQLWGIFSQHAVRRPRRAVGRRVGSSRSPWCRGPGPERTAARPMRPLILTPFEIHVGADIGTAFAESHDAASRSRAPNYLRVARSLPGAGSTPSPSRSSPRFPTPALPGSAGRTTRADQFCQWGLVGVDPLGSDGPDERIFTKSVVFRAQRGKSITGPISAMTETRRIHEFEARIIKKTPIICDQCS